MRRQTESAPLAERLAVDVENRLCALRGYCELARRKGESGEALARRMDSAIETVDELSELIRELVACLGAGPTRLEPGEDPRDPAGATL